MSHAQVLLDRVLDYAEDIVAGKITACKKHKWSAKRFLRDFENLENEEGKYYFDIDELENFHEWAKLFKHTKGVLTGQPIELVDFQLFIGANLFCFKRKANGRRRFNKAYIQLARKNAKTQFLAIISTYVAFLSEEQDECYIAGWSREQSSICYEEVLSQIRACDLLRNKFSDSYGKVKHYKTGSVIQPLSREARKTGDGKNPSLGVVDEYHAHETREIYDVLVSGTVARANALMVIITTAGFDLATPCFEEYEYLSKVLDPDNDAENDEYFAIICELDPEDDIKDEENWIKANPIVASYEEGIESLRQELKIALDMPNKMRAFLTKNMNRWVDQKDNAYMDMGKWRKCAGIMPELSGLKVYCGFDLSATMDLTSVGFDIPIDRVHHVFGHSFLPEERLREKMAIEKQPYDIWRDRGFVTATPGEVVNYHMVEEYILRKLDELNPSDVEICHDRWNAAHLAQSLMNRGLTVVEIPQIPKHLALPTKNFLESVFDKRVVHDDNPVVNWAVGNAVTHEDHQGNMMLSKKVSKNKIDPIAAIINAHARAMHDENNIDLNAYLTSSEFSF
ncbi:terminase large subunit [Aureibacillus halotolerans]|uniref:Phage terminase large subunit-like protein n=1 Tax=Aureibacillus halotolerans TaxID=1508390 RepID=A0A4R6TZ25_9BACI|nr:terminase TerL endonuclease subunit [Aureibacillus halotolerans]TDQ39228.1 phage terminase large subunit-like protein [Aureibacillus halotolerans]